MSPTPEVVRGFEPPPERWARGHRGVDLAGRPGSAVLSAGAGRVSYAGRLAGRGVVTVVHGELRTTYLPVRATVRVGQRVRAGEQIGLLERLPRHCAWLPSRQTCLHWGLLRGDTYLDPLRLVRDRRVRLLPVWGRPTPTGMPGEPGPGVGPAVPGIGPGLGDAHNSPAGRGTPGTPAESPAPIPGGPVHPELVNSALVGSGTAGITFLVLLLVSRLRRQGLRIPLRGRRDRPSATRNVIDFTTARNRRRPRRGPHGGPGPGAA